MSKFHKSSVCPTRSQRSKAGFTLPEVMIAAAIGSIVVAGAMYSYIWCLGMAAKSRQFSFAHVETLKSGTRLMRYMRNASSVHSIDTDGDWVQIVMPDGTVSRFEYINISGNQGDGQMKFVKDLTGGGGTNVVGKGLTKVMTTPVRNVFQQTGPDTLRIAYRITQPLTPNECPVEIDTGVRFRN